MYCKSQKLFMIFVKVGKIRTYWVQDKTGKSSVNTCLRDIFSTEVRYDRINEIFSHDNSTNCFPIGCIFAKQ